MRQLTYFFFSCTFALKLFINIYLNIAFLPPFYICFSASFSLSLIWFKAVLRTFKLGFSYCTGSDFDYPPNKPPKPPAFGFMFPKRPPTAGAVVDMLLLTNGLTSVGLSQFAATG